MLCTLLIDKVDKRVSKIGASVAVSGKVEEVVLVFEASVIDEADESLLSEAAWDASEHHSRDFCGKSSRIVEFLEVFLL